MDIRPTDSPAMIEASDRTPVHIRQEWTRRYDRGTGNWDHEYYFVCRFDDGSTEERWTIPNEWLAIERASKRAAA